MDSNTFKKENSYLYEKIIDESYDSITVTDSEGRFIIANKATVDCMQIPEEEILGKTPAELVGDGIYNTSTILEAMKTKQTVTGIVNVRGINRLSTSLPFLDEQGNVQFVMTNNRSDVIMDEFAKQLAYEQEQHAHYRNIADYFFSSNGTDMVYSSPQMHAIHSDCTTIAGADSAVMIIGESGVGKELIAKFIHSQSPRKEQAFIAVNCSTIPPELFESEFFGYRPGAFTGANSKGKTGLLQMAHKGTLFLDELGELPLLMQSKLLRFAESGEFFPIGSNKAEKVDVRIITATNRDLLTMMKNGEFRNDLYYRLHVFPIHIPPLRERPEDIGSISTYYIDRYNKKYGKDTYLSTSNINLLQSYHWPGNVRELRNIIERAVLMAPSGKSELQLNSMLLQEITHLPDSSASQALTDAPAASDMPSLDLPLNEALKQFEQQYIQAVLDKNGGRLQDAAASLGVHRTTLYRKIHGEKA